MPKKSQQETDYFTTSNQDKSDEFPLLQKHDLEEELQGRDGVFSTLNYWRQTIFGQNPTETKNPLSSPQKLTAATEKTYDLRYNSENETYSKKFDKKDPLPPGERAIFKYAATKSSLTFAAAEQKSKSATQELSEKVKKYEKIISETTLSKSEISSVVDFDRLKYLESLEKFFDPSKLEEFRENIAELRKVESSEASRSLNDGEKEELKEARKQIKELKIRKSLSQEEREDFLVAKNALANSQPITVSALDFGCGNGRSLELWIDLADQLKNSGVTLKVKSYDISQAGLDAYKNRMLGRDTALSSKQDLKFLKMTEDELRAQGNFTQTDQIVHCGTYKNNNLEIELLKGHESLSAAEFGTEIGTSDMSLILYGSLSHIPSLEARRDFLHQILVATKGYFVGTMPGQIYFREELKESAKNPNMREGETHYIPKELSDSAPIFFATYDLKLLKEFVKSSGAEEPEVSINSINNPSDLSKSSFVVKKLDSLASTLGSALIYYAPSLAEKLPSSIMNAGYWGVTAKGLASGVEVESKSAAQDSPRSAEEKFINRNKGGISL